ncbi:MAG: hypothetical protein MJ164_01445 [Alphaproteobacteria bacterium]|nr:hypothetical protein [Alphaproteobacteria bacterium]
MLKKFLFLISILFAPFISYGADTYSLDDFERGTDNTQCASKIFADALHATVDTLKNSDSQEPQDTQDADGSEIDTWVHLAFSMPTTITKILECPELQSADDNDTIVFETVSYTFPNGRTIDINYETQKSVLKQKLLLATKPKLTTNDINPDITTDVQNGTVWVNVDPAWYAILITEHDSLSNYIAPNKTNVLALRYIEDNIKTLYPQSHGFGTSCTSKSAIAGDNDMINLATTRTVGGGLPHEEPQTDAEKEQKETAESNDYYVYGDANLQWITGLEIAVDVVMTVITFGGYEFVNGALKLVRATRAFTKAQKALQTLKKSRDVIRWAKSSTRAANIERAIKLADKAEDGYSTISGISKTANQTVKQLSHNLDLLRARKADTKAIRAAEQELEIATKQAQAAEKAAGTAEKLKSAKNIRNNTKMTAEEAKNAEKEIENLKNAYNTELKELQKTHASELSDLEKLSDVKNYKELVNAKRELAHTAYLLRQGKVAWRANRGLLPVRAYRAAKATRQGLKSAKGMDKAIKVVRANTSGVSAKINDWLFHNTMKNITAISKVPAAISGLNMVVKIAGDMYDYTDVSTGDYTNNIDLKPFLLLGADELPGYENVVNHGMWLFWAGSSTSAADDDAAFLQAMSFAEKLHQDLVDIQQEKGVATCNVDIYVVRPIIRNPGTEKQELYYLFMNDTPWTTHGYNEPSNKNTTETSDNTTTNDNNFSLDSDGNLTLSTTTGTMGTLGNIKWTEPPYDGTKIGGACTKPSSSAGKFTNEILTTGRYASISPAFEKAMITKFRTEGECVNNPADKCGYTCFGVCATYFPQVKKKGFSRADAEDIAYNSFWKKHNLDKLPDAISGDVFMALWGTGSKPASIGLLQKILGVPQTSVVDEATIEAAKNYQGDLRTKFLDARGEKFKHGQSEFSRGWLNSLQVYRANGCHTISE